MPYVEFHIPTRKARRAAMRKPVRTALLKIRIPACLLALALSYLPLRSPAAEPCHFIHYNKENSGLSYNGVRAMIQDSRGYVWIGTHKGLSRYDGTRFRNYDRYDFGVESDYICVLEEDCDGNIWIGTDNGVVVYDYGSDSFHPLGELTGTEGLDDRIFAIVPDSEGNMWIGTRSCGVLRCNPHRGEMQLMAITDERGNPVVNFYKIAVDGSDGLWISVYCDNIYRLDSDSDVLTRICVEGDPDYFRNDDIEGLVVDDRSDDLLYVASKKYGLCAVDARNGTVRNLLTLSEGHRPTNLTKSAGRYLWLSSTEGLFRYDIRTGSSQLFRSDAADRFSLSDNYVTTSLVDRQHGLWVGTLNGGVNHYGPARNLFDKFYKTSDGASLEGCIVRGFAEDASGRVWIATEQAGLLALDGEELREWGPGRLPKSITAVCCDGDRLWIGTQNGICRLQPRTGAIESYAFPGNDTSVSDNRVVTIYRSGEGIVYVATAVGVLKYDRTENAFSPVDKLEELTIEHLVEDGHGKLWMASYSDGVFIYDPLFETLTRYCSRNGDCQIPEMTSSLCVDDSRRIWVVGFSSGFFRYEPDRDAFTTFDRTKLPSLPSDVYLSAAPDGRGNIWLSSDCGLVRYSPRSGLAKVFTTNDGLLDMNFKKSVLTLADGRLLFGSENGFIRFDPASFDAEPETVRVLVTDMTIGGVSRSPGTGRDVNVDMAGQVRLAPRENTFGFSFATPETPQSAYGSLLCRLEGYDTAWRDVSTARAVAFYNVPAGRYRLQLRTVAYDGAVREAHRDVEIVVEPRFWESPKGIALTLLLLSLLAGALFRYLYVRALREEKRKQEAYKREQEAELYNDKIAFFSNIVHEIKTPLTLIRTPLRHLLAGDRLDTAVTEDLQVIENSAEYLDRLVRELLDFVKVERQGYDLVLKSVDIVERLGFLCFNFAETARAKNVSLQYRHDEDCIWIDADESALNKMLNNLLHNAVKYAESRIDVHVCHRDDRVAVTIDNDGPAIPAELRERIFKPFVSYAGDAGKYASSFGIGLSLAKTFAELHRGELILDTEASCTRFVLRMPSRIGEKEPYKSPEMNLEEYVGSSTAPLLVLAEDNADLSAYLKRKLSGEFRIIAVPSAEQALELLGRYEVDLLITDIALQRMNGVELCRKVASDLDTSHVPVVVVSAISSVDTKIECMDNGAALYIEKPFSLDYLLSCIRNILDKRDAMRRAARSGGMGRMDAARFELPDLDKEFLRRLDAVILENLENPGFSNRQLEEKLFLSHSTLNRKVKALLDMTPNDYLRKKRLAAAAHLLETGNRRVNEICRSVGFPSPSYFSKCFREQYGMLPMEWRAKHSAGE